MEMEYSGSLLWLVLLLLHFIATRLMLVVFWGEMKTPIGARPGKLIMVPLVILAILSISAGFIEWPHNLLHITYFSDLVQKVLPATVLKENLPQEIIFQSNGHHVVVRVYYRIYFVLPKYVC